MNVGSKPPVIFLLGPTASGKTDLAMGLCEHLSVELISVDSAQVYCGMDIGTAKPDAGTLRRFPHRLIDIRDPAESYSAADFVADALREIQNIHARGKTPLLVGGTMLYFKALLDGLDDLPSSDPAIRAEIEAQAEAEGWPALHAELNRVDPVAAARLHPNHSRRIQRALEVFRITGVPLSEIQAAQQPTGFRQRFDLRQIAVTPADRALLHHRIELRLGHMFEQGIVEEVRSLYQRGDLHAELPSIRAVGYRQLWSFLSGEIELDEAKYRSLVATRKLAKRQLTWLRSWSTLSVLCADRSRQMKSTSELTLEALKLINL